MCVCQLHWLKIDFDKWKDEDDDEEEEGAAAKPDDYNMPGMEGFDMNAVRSSSPPPPSSQCGPRLASPVTADIDEAGRQRECYRQRCRQRLQKARLQ